MQRRLLGKALAAILALGLVAAATAGAASLITGKDIVNGTVTGADLKQGSVKLGDLSKKAKSSLAGVPGPAGPAGPQGEPGSADRYAEVTADGLLNDDVRNIEQGQITHDPDSGIYCFTFPAESRPVAGASNGVIGDVMTTLQMEPTGGINGCPDEANVRVVTYDLSDGVLADRAFRLVLQDG